MATELVGLNAVATIFVEGAPGTAEAFNDAERAAVFVAVVKAQLILGRLSRQFSPNRFLQTSFLNTFQSVTIDPGFIAPPTNTTGSKGLRDSEIETREGAWVLPTMAALGFPVATGVPADDAVAESLIQFVEALKARNFNVLDKPRRGFMIFVTKFPAGWSAYSNAVRSTIQFDWLATDPSDEFLNTGTGGWGLANFDRVIAHEMGHLFGGLDEYKDCDGALVSGPLLRANENCEASNPNSVPCLMRRNSETLCPATVSHFGWVDTTGDGVVDAAPPRPTAITPAAAGPGDLIAITGSRLGEARSVVFTGVGAAEFTIVSDDQLSVRVPDGEGRDIDVFVSTTLGISRPNQNLRFSYL